MARPVHAIVLLFPDTPEIVKRRTEEGPCAPVEPGDEPLWIPQVGVGGCGAHNSLLTSQVTAAARLQ